MKLMRTTESRGAMQLNYGVVGIVLFVIVFAGYLYVSTTTSASTTTSTTGQAITAQSGTFNIPANAVIVDIPPGGGYPYAQYSPALITVIIGVNNTVVWTNHDVLVHDAIANNGAFSSGDIAPGGAFLFTFTQAGTYTYYCSYHSIMSGIVTVKSA
jgi:plastocyanin